MPGYFGQRYEKHNGFTTLLNEISNKSFLIPFFLHVISFHQIQKSLKGAIERQQHQLVELKLCQHFQCGKRPLKSHY